MSIISSNNAGLREPITVEWLAQKGIFDKSDLVQLPAYDFVTGLHEWRSFSFWDYFECTFSNPYDDPNIFVLTTQSKMLYHQWFPAREIILKIELMNMLEEIREAKDSLEERNRKLHTPIT